MVEQIAARELLPYTHLTLTISSSELPFFMSSSQKYVQEIKKRIRKEESLSEVGRQARPQKGA